MNLWREKGVVIDESKVRDEKLDYQTKNKVEVRCFVLCLLSEDMLVSKKSIIYDKPVNLWGLFCLHSCSLYGLAVKIY